MGVVSRSLKLSAISNYEKALLGFRRRLERVAADLLLGMQVANSEYRLAFFSFSVE